MFRIHEHQVEHFARKLRGSFERRMAAYLKDGWADCFDGMSDDEIGAWVSEGVGKAVRYGIRTEPEVASLLLLFLVLGVDADETTPWAREVLADRALQADGKVKELAARARENGVPGIDAVVFDDEPAPSPIEGEALL